MKGCRPLSDEEVKVISHSFGGTFGKRNKALFILGVCSGFRISELLSLTAGDVQQHGKIVDHMTVARRHMKKKTEGRTVPLHPEAQAAWSHVSGGFLSWTKLTSQYFTIPPYPLEICKRGTHLRKNMMRVQYLSTVCGRPRRFCWKPRSSYRSTSIQV
jgi:site-specific recombinase XerC